MAIRRQFTKILPVKFPVYRKLSSFVKVYQSQVLDLPICQNFTLTNDYTIW